MKHIEAAAFGGPEVLTPVESPTPKPSEGMLLVEVKAAGINYADVMARSGFYPQIPQAPFVLGFELAGLVKAIGSGVEGFKEGDPVAAITLAGGAYATHAVVPAASAIPLPRGLDLGLAAAVLVQGLTAYMLIEEAHVKAGDAVLISAAAGGVGSIAVQIAKAKGAKVIGLTSRAKFELVRKLGADHVADYRDKDWATSVQAFVGDQGLQVYLDSIGELKTEAFSLLGKSAQWIVFGARSDAGDPLPHEAIYQMIEKNVTLRGFNIEASFAHVPRALGDLFSWIADGRLKLDITKYPLADAAKAHELFASRQTAGKLVLIP